MQHNPRISQRRVPISILLSALAFNQASCGQPERHEVTSELHDGGQTVGDILGFSEELQDHMKTVGNILDAAGSVVGAVGVVKNVLETLGIIKSNEAKLLAKLDALDKKLDRVMEVSIAGTNILARRMVDEKLGVIRAANVALKDHLQNIGAGGRDTETDRVQRGVHISALQSAIQALAGPAFSQRPFDNHTALQGDWMGTIQDRADNIEGAVYDHRLALPVLLEGIATRVLWMSAEEPEFHLNGRFSAELRDYASILRRFIAKMESGVRCSKIPDQWFVGYSVLATGCADIYSGVSSFDRDWLVNENKRSPIIPYNLETISKRHAQRLIADNFNVKLKLGIFQLYSLADKLEKYTVIKFAPTPIDSTKSARYGINYWVDSNPLWPGVYYSSSQSACAADEGPGEQNCRLLSLPKLRTDVAYWVDTNPSWPGVYYAKINTECPYGGSSAGPNCQIVRFRP